MKKKESFIQAIKFTLFSISAGIIQVVSFTILNELLPVFDGDYGVNYCVSLILSIIWNFTFNRKFTFQSSNNIKKSMLLIFIFYLIFTPLSAVIGNFFQKNGGNEYLILAITMILNFVLEFIYCKLIVFKKVEN